MMRPLHAHTAVLFRFFLSKYIIMDFGKDSSTDKTFVRYHGLRTPNIYLSALDFCNSPVWNIDFDEVEFFPSLHWIFLLSVACKIQWRHESKKSENLGWCGRQNILRPYLKFGIGSWFLTMQWRRFSHRASVVRLCSDVKGLIFF